MSSPLSMEDLLATGASMPEMGGVKYRLTDEKTIMLGAIDEGSADEMVYALIECHFRRKLRGVTE